MRLLLKHALHHVMGDFYLKGKWILTLNIENVIILTVYYTKRFQQFKNFMSLDWIQNSVFFQHLCTGH